MGKSKNETPEQREKRLAYNREWNRKNKERENRKRRDRYRLWQKDSQISEYNIKRVEVLNKMGGKCVFCGETDWAVLSIDHVKNDGAKERKSERNLYAKLHKADAIPKDRYQILCLYCNHKKRIFGDDPLQWPPTRSVSEQLSFLKASVVSMEEARKAYKNASPPKKD